MQTKRPETRHLWVIRDTLCIKENVLYKQYKGADGTQDRLRLIVPSSLRKEVLLLVHDALSAGHFCIKKTVALLGQSFTGMRQKSMSGFI
ncbi:hypothetical protein DPMN_011994 [Dreissena polymorpha]|uniref:Integrase zinc-binding domain-containing protein n=1 Tax=Dreissena polymorpha TaxID=45954 RepID=A0A9D4S2Z1_DREPO|nr:hypothetical protein DPMN_011994 [Dreissena polymorpha]